MSKLGALGMGPRDRPTPGVECRDASAHSDAALSRLQKCPSASKLGLSGQSSESECACLLPPPFHRPFLSPTSANVRSQILVLFSDPTLLGGHVPQSALIHLLFSVPGQPTTPAFGTRVHVVGTRVHTRFRDQSPCSNIPSFQIRFCT